MTALVLSSPRRISPPKVALQVPVNPWLIACAVMTAVFMVVLDTTVVNVALPNIAGSMSAGTEEATLSAPPGTNLS